MAETYNHLLQTIARLLANFKVQTNSIIQDKKY